MRSSLLTISIGCAALALLGGSVALGASASAPNRIPAIVELAAASNARSLDGALIHERHITIAVSAGPVHYREQNDAMLLMVGGEYERLRYTSVIENGKVLGATAVAQREATTNRELQAGSGSFKQPFDKHFLHDYTYTSDVPCACSASEEAVRFQSIVRDDQHGDGTMRIDRATGRVLGVTYTPDVLPAHANSCTTTESFAQVLPGVWTIDRIERSYRGHVAFFGGGGDVVETLDHFKSVGSPRAGLAYLHDIAQARLR